MVVASLSIFAATAVGMLGSAPALAATDGFLLKVGSAGSDVSTLQQDLRALGYFPSDEGITNYFGPTTRKALLAFEQDRGLKRSDAVDASLMRLIHTAAEKSQAPHRKDAARDSNGSLGQQIVQKALSFVGAPYVWGGDTPSGFDCSGFTHYVYSLFGIALASTAAAQAQQGQYVSKAGLEPGDLVFFDTMGGISHVGIYIGDGKFVDAASTDVEVDSLNDPYYWASRYVTARRII